MEFLRRFQSDTDGTVTTLLWVLLVVAVAFMLLHLAPKLVEFYEMARAVLAALRSERYLSD